MSTPVQAPVNPASQVQGAINLSALQPADQIKVIQAQIAKVQADAALNIAYANGLIASIQAAQLPVTPPADSTNSTDSTTIA